MNTNPTPAGIVTESGKAAMADLRALFATVTPSLASPPPPPNPHGMRTESGRQAIADFEDFISRTMPPPSPDAVIPPNPPPPGGISATMLRRLAGEGPLVPETIQDTPAAHRLALAMVRLDRMAAIMAQSAEQSDSQAPLAVRRFGPRP